LLVFLALAGFLRAPGRGAFLSFPPEFIMFGLGRRRLGRRHRFKMRAHRAPHFDQHRAEIAEAPADFFGPSVNMGLRPVMFAAVIAKIPQERVDTRLDAAVSVDVWVIGCPKPLNSSCYAADYRCGSRLAHRGVLTPAASWIDDPCHLVGQNHQGLRWRGDVTLKDRFDFLRQGTAFRRGLGFKE
jgi:hypothetical protein